MIPFFPLASFFIAGLGGRYIGARNASYLTTLLVGITFFTALCCFVQAGLGGSSVIIKIGDWVTCGLFEIHWGFLFDPLSLGIVCVVSGVSFLVHF